MKPLPSRKVLLAHFETRDPRMAEVVRRVGPFRLGRNRNFFVVLCKSIVAQQISTQAADSIYRRFHALFAGRAPTPARVQDAPEETLRGAGLSRQKVAYLKDLSARFLDGGIRPHRFAALDNESIVRQLVQVHGIGRWTAEMFLIFSLNRMDVLPVGDLGLRVAVRDLYRMRDLPKPDRLRALGRKWHPWETAATWYAWRTLDNTIINY